MAQLFEFTSALFEQPGKWAKFTKADKNKHFFMTSRFMAITFPLQALALNHVKMDAPAAMDFWQGFMRMRYKRVPTWMYIKGSVKKKEDKVKVTKVSDKMITDYAKAHFIEIKSVQDMIKFFPVEAVKEIKKWEKIKT